MVKQRHHDNEVELILDDIRDTLAPHSNPDCTFITRRHDKRLQERLIDLSAKEDPKQWSGLVYTRDLEQTAVGWQDVIPYPKYVDKRPAEKVPTKRLRHTNPVDNSTIVRHLQERIRKWADRKPGIYTRKSYSTATMQRGAVVPSCPSQSKVALISSVELPTNTEAEQKPSLAVRKSNSNEGASTGPSPNSSDKLAVSWNILSQNEAAHLNLQTYGMDPNVTYVPARRQNSHMNSYTASKKYEQQERTAAKQQQLYGGRRGAGVLHPARAPRYKSRKPGVRLRRYPESTEDVTEEYDFDEDPSNHHSNQQVSRPREKFKCSICIEGLQVADWPTNIEYGEDSADNAVTHSKIQGKNLMGGISDSLANYKTYKAPVDLGSATSLALIGGEGREGRVGVSKRISPGQLYHGSASLRGESGTAGTAGTNQDRLLNKGRLLDLKQLVIKERVNPAALRSARANRKKQGGNSASPMSGKSADRRTLRRSDRTEEGSLYDRFQASKSGKRKRKMYGVSICDVYESKQEPDVFSYGLFLSTPLATPPSKQKLDPLMNIKPVKYINNLKSH
ncbi:hypothetical protein ACHWQZ_G002078 [Mnemiopsis leidyi]